MDYYQTLWTRLRLTSEATLCELQNEMNRNSDMWDFLAGLSNSTSSVRLSLNQTQSMRNCFPLQERLVCVLKHMGVRNFSVRPVSSGVRSELQFKFHDCDNGVGKIPILTYRTLLVCLMYSHFKDRSFLDLGNPNWRLPAREYDDVLARIVKPHQPNTNPWTTTTR
jgi:hypothetical protein